MASIIITINQIRHGIGYRFRLEIYQKLLIVTIVARIIQTCPGTPRFGSVKTDEFVRPPNLCKPRIPVETKGPLSAIWSRVHRISARDNFLDHFAEPDTFAFVVL